MKFSYDWISELVPGLSVEPDELRALITMKTAECEGIERHGEHFEQVRCVRVTAVEALPKGKNRLATIDVGRGESKRVVCGAPNVERGILAAWVPPGTTLAGKQIGRAVIEGVESEGMLASAAELGLGSDHSGLLLLSGLNPGDSLPRLQPDWTIEIDNKSLTHRPDLWGHYGMAREVAAITGGALRDPVDLSVLPQGAGPVRVDIADYTLCPRYSALLVENVTVQPSPLWLQARLDSIGLNAISNIVDLTNYALAELPQPMHAFDADKLNGDTIYVRTARSGEKLKALNGETYELDPADLVIADAQGPIAIAGVIGGADGAVSESTKRIVFESANFLGASVRLSSARHKLRTDASMRFEKSLDPENTVRGLARVVQLLHQVDPGARVIGGVTDRRTAAHLIAPIALTAEFISHKLGKQLTSGEIAHILRALGFGVQGSEEMTLTIPSWRATKDISLKEDLVEEIGRIIGYGEITPTAPRVACVPPPANPMRAYIRKLRPIMAQQGFTEAYNYSFVNESDAKRFSLPIDEHIAVRNPIASELTHLRRSLLPGLFRNVLTNVHNFREIRLFEIGSEIHASNGPDLPRERPHLAAAFYSAHSEEQDFFELKRVLECAFPGVRLHAVAALAYEHPTRTAEAIWDGERIGRLFEVHPSLLLHEGLEGRCVMFDVDLDNALSVASREKVRYVPLRKYPTSGFDLSVVCTEHVPVAIVQDELSAATGSALAAIEFVRQYAGPPLPEDHKSVTFHLQVGSLDHTLTADEVTAVRSRAIDAMRAAGYDLRI